MISAISGSESTKDFSSIYIFESEGRKFVG